MAEIHGYGVYIPRYRIATAEIAQAWGRPEGRGEKAVAAPDEDVLTMGVKAARAALEMADIPAEELGAVYFATVSSGYAEGALAAQAAQLLGTPPDIAALDLGLSTRAVTSAWRACSDALEAGWADYGLIIAADRLCTRPGSGYELHYAAGAGALVLSNRKGFALAEGVASHSSGFVGRFRLEGEFHAQIDERFVMEQGYLEHTQLAVRELMRGLEFELDEFALVVLHSPEPRWGSRALKRLGLDARKLVSTAPQIGYAGCASLLIDLALAFENLGPDQRILAVSYGPGGSDALALKTSQAPPKAGVEAGLKEKELISYPVYLRYQGLLGGGR